MAEVGKKLYLGGEPITLIQNNGFVYVDPFFDAGQIIDPDATAFLTAAGITDQTISDAINQLVLDMKSAGIWSKCTAIYPFVGGTATTHKYNLKDPRDLDAAFRIAFIGGMSHSSNGITGNGTSNWATTYMNAQNELNGGNAQNDNHVFYYLQTFSARSCSDIGVYDSSANALHNSNARNASNVFNTANMNANQYNGVATTATSGAFCNTRTSSTEYRKYINKSQTIVTNNSTTPPNRDFFIMAFNNTGSPAGYSDRTMSLVSLGAGLTQSEVESYVDINQTFQTSLSRFV